jgi:hypothetical protein
LEITTAITTTQIHGIYDAHNFGLIASLIRLADLIGKAEHHERLGDTAEHTRRAIKRAVNHDHVVGAGGMSSNQPARRQELLQIAADLMRMRRAFGSAKSCQTLLVSLLFGLGHLILPFLIAAARSGHG